MKKLSCPRLVAYSFLMPSVICAFILTAKTIISGITSTVFMAVGIIWVILITIMCIVYKNAFVFLNIDKSGIYSKHTHLDWDQITDISFLHIRIGFIPVYLKTTVAVFNSEAKTFFKLDKRKILYFEVSKSFISEFNNTINESDKDTILSKMIAVFQSKL